MITFTRRSNWLSPAFAALACRPDSPALRPEPQPAAVAYQMPDQIKWSPPSPNGAQNAVLVGDPTKEGLYVQMVKWLGGNHFSHPHFHPHDRFITVLNGTWWVGTGTKFDPQAHRADAARHVRHPFRQAGAFRRRQGGGRTLAHRRRRPGDTSTPAESRSEFGVCGSAQAADFGRWRCWRWPRGRRRRVARLTRSRISSIEAISMRLRPLSLAR